MVGAINHNSIATTRIKQIQTELRRINREKQAELVQWTVAEVTAAARELGIEARTSKALQASVNREIHCSGFHSGEQEEIFDAVRHGTKKAPREAAWSRYAVLRCITLLLNECQNRDECWRDSQAVLLPRSLDFTLNVLELMHEQLPAAASVPPSPRPHFISLTLA